MYHVLPRMACRFAIVAFALAHCGCQSLQGPSGWTSAWKPKPKKPGDREVVTYLGQKKKEPKANPEELKARLAEAREASEKPTFDMCLREGNRALRENRLADARREFEKGLELRPNDVDCHHRLAVVADKERQFGLADDHYQAALKLRPRDPNLLSDMGYSYSLRGDDRRAESTLQEALAIAPSHKGAMGNLGVIYSRQGRYDDAAAMFRKGASDAEAQHYLAQLFPNRTPGSPSGTELVNHTAPERSTPQIPDEAPDFRNMSPEQLKEAMNRERQQGQQRRRDQMMAEAPPRRDWMSDVPPAQNSLPTQNPAGQGGAIVIGPGPNGAEFPEPRITPAPNGGYADLSRTPGANLQSGSVPAQPGTSPRMDLWQGAGSRDVQTASGLRPAQPDITAGQPGGAPPSAQYPAPGAFGGPSPSEAQIVAAQLGMNVGAGGLFPVVSGNPASAMPLPTGRPGFENRSSFNPSGIDPRSGFENRPTSEFAVPSQFQNSQPQNSNAPIYRGSFAPAETWQGAGASLPARNPQLELQDSIAPASPANWPVIQAGGSSAGPAQDPRMMAPAASWADKPNLNGAAPFNGAWPPNAAAGNAFPQGQPMTQPNQPGTGLPNGLPGGTPGGNGFGPGATSAPPQWNNFTQDPRFQPATFGNAAQPEQWPHTPR